MRKIILATAMAALSIPGLAAAQVAIDGTRDAAYGAAKSTVSFVPGTPEGNFAAPTPFSDAIGYSISLTSDANYVYGYLNATGSGAAVGNFANLYFDIDPQNHNGSDIGFEITNQRGFVAGGLPNSYSAQAIDYYAKDGIVEFAIPNSAFTGPMAGLADEYAPGQQFATIGSTVTLRLSQSFGYSVAGGPIYGNDRLGSVTLGGAAGAVPEPATWAMMLVGLGMVGAGVRRRGKQAARVTHA